MHTIKEAARRTIDFIGGKALAIGALAIVLWLLKNGIHLGQVNMHSDLALLVLSYAIVGLGVFISKIFEAHKALAEEKPWLEQINRLSPEAQESLRILALMGEGGHGETPGIGEVVKSTDFMGRDYTGPIILGRYRDFLLKWAKKQQAK